MYKVSSLHHKCLFNTVIRFSPHRTTNDIAIAIAFNCRLRLYNNITDIYHSRHSRKRVHATLLRPRIFRLTSSTLFSGRVSVNCHVDHTIAITSPLSTLTIINSRKHARARHRHDADLFAGARTSSTLSDRLNTKVVARQLIDELNNR